eukprot:scaffold80909_cov62-Phaeocystis_antarctica.AAC.14
MVVTLDVSKLSGWLNTGGGESCAMVASGHAFCRESKRGHAMRGELRGPGGGRRRATAVTTAVHAACTGGLDPQGQGRGGGAHVEHAVHICDAGGVEAQRLVERIRGLPRVETRAHAMRGEVRAGMPEVAGDRGARSVQGRARLQIGGSAGHGHTMNM